MNFHPFAKSKALDAIESAKPIVDTSDRLIAKLLDGLMAGKPTLAEFWKARKAIDETVRAVERANTMADCEYAEKGAWFYVKNAMDAGAIPRDYRYYIADGVFYLGCDCISGTKSSWSIKSSQEAK